jgi:hypothetical protein
MAVRTALLIFAPILERRVGMCALRNSEIIEIIESGRHKDLMRHAGLALG